LNSKVDCDRRRKRALFTSLTLGDSAEEHSQSRRTDALPTALIVAIALPFNQSDTTYSHNVLRFKDTGLGRCVTSSFLYEPVERILVRKIQLKPSLLTSK
jgi:hypothetical protein